MTHRLRDILITAARLAGEVQKGFLAGGRDSLNLKDKYKTGTSADAITPADIESERVLREYFRETMPDYNVLGEELGGEYNGNGKVILMDPLDGTRHFKEYFKERQPRFGPIIGVYEQGRNVAGIAHNVLRDLTYVATDETGLERIGAAEEGWPPGVIYVGGDVAGCPAFQSDLARIIQESFPDNQIIAKSGEHDVLHQARVCAGKWIVYFHAGQGRHDIAAAPIFGRVTGTNVTDHNGKPYDFLDAELEAEKYKNGAHGVVNSTTILMAKEPYFEAMLKALEPYKPQLDRRQVPGRRDSLKLPILKR